MDYENIEFLPSADLYAKNANIPAEGKSFTLIPSGKNKDQAKNVRIGVCEYIIHGALLGSQEIKVDFSDESFKWNEPVLCGDWGNIRYRNLNNPETPFAIDIQINENSSDVPLAIQIGFGCGYIYLDLTLIQAAADPQQ